MFALTLLPLETLLPKRKSYSSTPEHSHTHKQCQIFRLIWHEKMANRLDVAGDFKS
jgi:hypothetical protein